MSGRRLLVGGLVAASLVALQAPAASGAPSAAPAARAKLFSLGGRALPARYQRWARASLMPLVPGRVYIGLRGCPSRPRAAGCVVTSRRRTVYVRRRGLSAGRVKKSLFHELGHLFDLRVMNNRDRGAYKRIFRIRRAWWGRRPVAELFAESYSFCARFRRIGSVLRYANYGYDPTTAQHDRACRLIVSAARDRGRARPAPRTPPRTDPQPTPPPQPSGGPDTIPGQPPGVPLPPLEGPPIPLP